MMNPHKDHQMLTLAAILQLILLRLLINTFFKEYVQKQYMYMQLVKQNNTNAKQI